MPRRPPALPAELCPTGFAVAEALAAGVTRDRLRCSDLATPHRGVRLPREGVSRPLTWDEDPATRPLGRAADEEVRRRVLARCRALLPVLPIEAAFSHETAARLLLLPLPGHYRDDEPLHVSYPTRADRMRRLDICGHRGLESRDVVTVDDDEVRVVAGPDTWADLAQRLSLDALVALGDQVAHRSLGLPIDELVVVRDSRHGGRGARRMDLALPLIRRGSESPQETRARLRFVEARLPEPELNAVVDDRGGEWIATADFVWRERRVLAEFDGDHHRVDRDQWQRDVTRRELCCDNGWTYLQLTADDIGRRLLSTTARLHRLLD